MRVSEIITESVLRLKAAGIENCRLDAEVLTAHALNTDRSRIIIDSTRELSKKESAEILRLISRREKFEPVAYITGAKEFYSLDFIVNPHVLIPRPETELVVDLAIYYAPRDSTACDIGTGSGAIAVALKHNRADLDVHASDISYEALKIARKNSRAINGARRVKFHEGEFFEPFGSMIFDCIISNPPYVDPARKNTLQRDISFEPDAALFAHDSGRAALRRIVSDARKYLADGGVVILEIGEDQKDFIQGHGKSEGFEVSVLNDYSSLPRVAVLK